MHVYDEDKDEGDGDEDGMCGVIQEENNQLPPKIPYEESGPQTEESSPRQSSDSKDLVVEREPTPEPNSPATSIPSSLGTASNTPVMRVGNSPASATVCGVPHIK